MIITTVNATAQVISAYNYKTAVDRLSAILTRHIENTDTLSVRLFRWGATVLQTAKSSMSNQEEKDDGDERILSIAREKIAVLVDEILVNPIDNSPLKEPILERNITWESWTHREYKTLFSISPLDDGEMLQNPPPHLFAREMIQWAHDFTPSLGTPALAHFPEHRVAVGNSGGQLIPAHLEALARHPQLIGPRRWIYQRLAQSVVLREQNRTLREEMEGALVRADQFVSEMQQKSQIVIAEAMQRAGEHEEGIRGKIESVNQIHKKALAELNEQMSWIEQTHKENISTLEKRIASMDAVNAAIAGSLKAQVVAMNQEHQRTTTALQNQIHSINESHRSSVSMLEGKISSSNAAISSMSRSHQTKVSNLKGQLSHSATSLQQAEQVIRQEQQRNANNVAEINNLRNERARAQREMANLRQAINDLDDDDGFCVIA